MNDPAASSSFVTTQWTRVLASRGSSEEARTALSELCAAYYAPVFVFIRCNAPDEETARDLTQEFFSRVLARQGIDGVDRQRGRFRSFLLGAVKHFLAEMRGRGRRLKRGGGQTPIPIDSDTSLQLPDPNIPGPDTEFDRKWALTLLERALVNLAAEQAAANKADQFTALKPWLVGDTEGASQADVARKIGLNEGAVKVAIHRLRRRFREMVKAEIAATLADKSQVDAELKELLRALH